MSATPLPPGLTESDFERIEAAVLETERGRWFLTEYARRIRAAETQVLRTALSRIEGVLSLSDPAQAASRFGATLEALRERLQDLAWRLREAGFSEASEVVRSEADQLIAFSALDAPRAIAGAPGLGDKTGAIPYQGQGAISLRLQSIGAMDQAPPSHVAAATVLTTPSLPESGTDPRVEAFAVLDGLSVQEKLAFFA